MHGAMEVLRDAMRTGLIGDGGDGNEELCSTPRSTHPGPSATEKQQAVQLGKTVT